MRRPGRAFARPGAAPLRRLRRHLPLQGRLLGAAAQKGSPARGAGCAGRRRLRGALPLCGGNTPQGPAGHLQGQVRHPPVACGDTPPSRRGFWDGGPQKGSPARGAGCAGRRRLRGALPVCGGTIWQGLAEPCPMFLRGRCLHRPANLAAARCSRFCRPCALYCRAGVHARRGRGCSGGGRVGLMQHLSPQYTAMPQGPAAGEIARPTLRPKTGSNP